MPEYKLQKKARRTYIELPNAFIDQYLPEANGLYIKVYLLGFAQCFRDNPLDNKGIAKALNMLESDVVAAWLYWEQQGIVHLTAASGGGFDVTFMDVSAEKGKEAEKEGEKPKASPAETRPSYTPSEIAREIEQSEELRFMFEITQKILNKTLSSAETQTLFSFYDWLRLPVDVIVMLVGHCASLGRSNMRYIEKAAISWTDLGIDTLHKAEEHLKQADKDYSHLGALRRRLGITGRNFTEAEVRMAEGWLKVMGLSVDLIARAGEIAASNTGKVSFGYMDKILKDWHEKGVKTVEQADLVRKAASPRRAASKAQPQSGGNSGFDTFTGKPIDFDDIERRAMELLHRKSNGA